MVGDIRDIAAGIHGLATGQEDALQNLGWASIGLIPVIGDIAKHADTAADLARGVSKGTEAARAGRSGTSLTPLSDIRGPRSATGVADPVTGQRVYRVYGQDPATPALVPLQSGPYGSSWTRVDPRSITKYRDVAGLPDDRNLGRFLIEGVLRDPTDVVATRAAPIGANRGGLDELIIPNPRSQVDILNVYGLNPEF
jgi:hypothetical protein